MCIRDRQVPDAIKKANEMARRKLTHIPLREGRTIHHDVKAKDGSGRIVLRAASKDRFRLSISRSSKNISAQIIDDAKNVTLLSASSVEKDLKSVDKISKTELSKKVAANLAKKAQEKKITKIFFDRGVYRYHGRVKVFAETLRENGMDF